MHAQHFLIAERERSMNGSCRVGIGGFRAEPTNYPRCLHPSEHLHISVPTYTTRNPQVKKCSPFNVTLVNMFYIGANAYNLIMNSIM